MKIFNKYIKIEWQENQFHNGGMKEGVNLFDPRRCTRDDLNGYLKEQGAFLICPPKKGISMKTSKEGEVKSEIVFSIKVRNKNKETLDFLKKIFMRRYQNSPIVDM